MTTRLLAVPDTNLWIDLDIAGLLDEAFQLDIDWLAPDIVIEELDEPQGSELTKRGLVSHELDSEHVGSVIGLTERYPQLSVQDVFALATAKVLDALLVTGDRHMRHAARENGLRYHGVLWVLDEMLEAGLIPPSRAAEALGRMLAEGSRLPERECTTRLRKWNKG